MGLSPLVDYQQALNDSVDANLGRLDNNNILAEGLDADRAFPGMLDMDYYTAETRAICGAIGAGPAVDEQVDR
ncbi:hypothetical protein PAXINDRAFT_166939 [Paxillus involutus ATCC 200175]|nr:hypothetical protein PAXINDRAFT_166939 [Paxillus involutus ATCC 200175]